MFRLNPFLATKFTALFEKREPQLNVGLLHKRLTYHHEFICLKELFTTGYVQKIFLSIMKEVIQS